jgi:SAM-dependent methyltransferase
MVVDTQYPPFLRGLYSAQPELSRRGFDLQRRALLDAAFGSSDHYSRHLRRSGHEVADVIANAFPAQRRWAREAGYAALSRLPPTRAWAAMVLERQVVEFEPDVVWLLDMGYLTDEAVRRLRNRVPLLIGQVACPFDFTRDVAPYDLVVSSLPHFVRRFRQLGVRSEYLPLGFEPGLRTRIDTDGVRDIEVSFVGSTGAAHGLSTAVLDTVAGAIPLSFWGPTQARLPAALASRHRGTAWGLEMYSVLAHSQVALNRHIDIAADYANNLRLFEATGMGACLLTDDKRNLSELFTPGEELVTYTDADDCVRQARHLLSDFAMREGIAAAGLRRTLRDHTYDKRVHALLEMLPTSEPHGSSQVSRGRATFPGLARAQMTVERLAANVQRQRSSRGFRILEGANSSSLANAWKHPSIARRQQAVANRALRHMYQGSAPAEFFVAAAAVDATRLTCPSIAEIGCGSGYYCEALAHLTSGDIEYTGVDYSFALLASSRKRRGRLRLIAGDATRLPFVDSSFDVVLSAAVLMHVPNWTAALTESFRVSREFVVLHRTPIADVSSTTHLEKRAYGVRVVEHVFARAELDAAIQDLGGTVVRSWTLSRSRRPPLNHDVDVVTLLVRRGES